MSNEYKKKDKYRQNKKFNSTLREIVQIYKNLKYFLESRSNSSNKAEKQMVKIKTGIKIEL